MKRKFSLAGALAVAAMLTLGGCGTAAQDGAATGSPAMDMHGSESMELMIHIQGGKFIDPQPVAAGATVTVMNMDSAAQSVISDDATSFTVSAPAGGLATFTAPGKPGSYPFHNASGEMKGTLTVEDSAPSPAATMVCAQPAKDSVKEILALSAVPATQDTWDGRAYACTYHLDGGDFVMSVTEAADDNSAAAGAKHLAGELNAQPIEGLANLGLPGYQSSDGTVIFAKDNMTLHVDATAFGEPMGPDRITASKFAYEMATTILGCWSAHHQ